MSRTQSATRSGLFRTFYYFALIAWTVASLGLVGQIRKDLRMGEFAAFFFAVALMALGWILPNLQSKHPENRLLNRVVFFFPIFCTVILVVALIVGVMFGAA
jgi:hypothetical protein